MTEGATKISKGNMKEGEEKGRRVRTSEREEEGLKKMREAREGSKIYLDDLRA